MSNLTFVKNSFVDGEVSELVHQSGSDLDIYKGCLKQCHNYIPLKTRALLRRLGTRVYLTAFTDLKGVFRLISFTVDPDLNYLLIFAENTIVIVRREGDNLRLESRIDTPYKGADISYLDFAQNIDTLFFVCGGYSPNRLMRTDKGWVFEQIEFQMKPFLGETIIKEKPHLNINLHIPHGKVDTVEVLSDGDIFKERDKGRSLSLGWYIPRWKKSAIYSIGSFVIAHTNEGGTKREDKVFKCVKGGNSGTFDWQATSSPRQESGECIWEVVEDKSTGHTLKWAWGTITEVRTPRSVLLNLATPVQDDTPTLHWRFGAWGQEGGYPPLITFHEDRLVFSGNSEDPQSILFSETSNYTNFSVTDDSGDVQPQL